MTDMERKTFCAALSRYGAQAQITMVFEEMAELQDVLCKFLRGRVDGDTLANIAEEIADVGIMLDQMAIEFEVEDAGLEPREVSAIVKDWSDLCTVIGECGGIDRLRELAEADKEGRLVVLPCQVGTATYYIRYPIAVYPDESEPEIKRGIFTLCDLDRVGHSVFLTREEAEKALEAMKK